MRAGGGDACSVVQAEEVHAPSVGGARDWRSARSEEAEVCAD
jgi:hypothetical protein